MRALAVREFEWDDGNELHATKHGISADEHEEVILSVEGKTIFKAHPYCGDRIYAFGRSTGGRWIFSVFAYSDDEGIARPISGRLMNKGERTKYER